MHEKILDVCRRRGIIYPSFEIYGGTSGFYDYGPIGSLIKWRVEKLIREYYVIEENCFEVQCPTLTPEDVWVASGHVESFTDRIVECQKCGEPYKAESLVEERTGESIGGRNVMEVMETISENNIVCPKCGGQLGEIYDYNLMFQTFIGPGKYKLTGYLRPETAQTTYLGFNRLWEVARKKLPFGVLQIGHSFRNEISPRQGMIRLREFNQAEIQFFVEPDNKKSHRIGEVGDIKTRIVPKDGKNRDMTIGDAVKQGIIPIELIGYHLGKAFMLFKDMGINPKKLELRQHKDNERAFYSNDTWDIEFISDSFGKIELVGVADRTDYDLSSHMKLSGKDMSVSFNGKKFIPHIIEIAYGIDRPFYCILESCYKEENRTYFSFPKHIAPYSAGVFPLVNKGGLPEKSVEVFEALKKLKFYVFYDNSGSIGRRYARADEIGVPYCITIDYDTIDDDTVTLRERDNREQTRVRISELKDSLPI